MNSLDLGRAFKAPFDDPDWVNRTLMGFLWGLLGITAPAVYGAQLEYIRNVSHGDERLPDWNDFGRKWVEGFLLGVAGFIYFLPILILGGIMVVPSVFTAMAAGGDSDAFGAMLGGSLCLFSIIAVVYTIVVSIYYSAAMAHYAMRRSFGAFFEFGAIMSKVRGGTGYYTAWMYVLIISFALSTAISLVTGATGGLGYIVVPALSYLGAMMMGHMLGQWARAAYATGTGAAATVPPGYAPPPPPAGPTGYMPPPSPPHPVAPPSNAPVSGPPTTGGPAAYAPPPPPAANDPAAPQEGADSPMAPPQTPPG